MGIEQCKQDLAALEERLKTTTDIQQFLRDDLFPWLASLTDEIGEMDEAIEDVVHQSVDVLHSESAGVFAAVITVGLTIATELAQRAGNDVRLLAMIKDFRRVAKQAGDLLAEITLEDDEDEDGEEDDDGDDGPGAPADKPQEGKDA